MKKTIVINFECLRNGHINATVTVSKGFVKDEVIAVLDVVKEGIIKAAANKVDIQKDKT